MKAMFGLGKRSHAFGCKKSGKRDEVEVKTRCTAGPWLTTIITRPSKRDIDTPLPLSLLWVKRASQKVTGSNNIETNSPNNGNRRNQPPRPLPLPLPVPLAWLLPLAQHRRSNNKANATTVEITHIRICTASL